MKLTCTTRLTPGTELLVDRHGTVEFEADFGRAIAIGIEHVTLNLTASGAIGPRADFWRLVFVGQGAALDGEQTAMELQLCPEQIKALHVDLAQALLAEDRA